MSNDKDKQNKSKKSINIQKYEPTEFEKEDIPYTLICNKVIQKITNFTAGFIWIYLQSMPPTWEPNKYQIMDHFDISEATYKRHMAYLSRCGLVEYRQPRGDKGRMLAGKLIVLNGSKFNENGDKYRGIIFDTADEPALALVSDRSIISPVCGGTGGTANELHINTITSINAISHTKGDFFLEKNLFLDSEQQRKAILLREQCLADVKCLERYEKLKTEQPMEKTFIEILDECVTHYATEECPRLVSPGRLLSWLNREKIYEIRARANKPNYPTATEREKSKQESIAREQKELRAKEEERKQAPKIMQAIRENISFQERMVRSEKEREALGLNTEQYLKHLLKKGEIKENNGSDKGTMPENNI